MTRLNEFEIESLFEEDDESLQISAHVDTSNELLEKEKKKHMYFVQTEKRCKESNCLHKTLKLTILSVQRDIDLRYS